MAIQITQNRSNDLTSFIGTGRIKVSDLMHEVANFYKGRPTKNVLLNFLDADLWEVNAKDIEFISSYIMRYQSNFNREKTAIVTGDEHSYNLSIWFRNWGEFNKIPFQVKVFKSLTEAKQWLD